MKKHITFLLILTVTFSCIKRLDTAKFYFQLNDFSNTKVYKFQSIDEPSKFEYLKITSDTLNKKLLTERFNEKVFKIDEFLERKTKTGFTLISYYKQEITEHGFLNKMEFYPKKNEVFNWYHETKAVYSGEFIDNGNIWELIRTREFIEYKKKLNIQSKKYSVLVFKDSYEFNSLDNQAIPHTNYHNFIQTSYFAFDYGLVKYEREYKNGKKETYELIDIIENANEFGIRVEKKKISNVNKKEFPDFVKRIRKNILENYKFDNNHFFYGDFNADMKMDFTAIVTNTKTNEKGVIIIHNSSENKYQIFGAGIEIDGKTNLSWIDTFESIKKFTTIEPTIIDKETGDIITPKEKVEYKLQGNGIYMHENEVCGGGILYWTGTKYEWMHIE